jgi:hypothetical protein
VSLDATRAPLYATVLPLAAAYGHPDGELPEYPRPVPRAATRRPPKRGGETA